MIIFLNRTRLGAFKTWLDAQSVAYRDGKGEDQVLQVFDDDMWHVLHSGKAYPEHYKAVGTLARRVREYNEEA